MKKYVGIIIIIVILLIPNALFSFFDTEKTTSLLPVFTNETQATSPSKTQQTLLIKNDSNIVEMDIESYVLCVLLGEIPANFEEEALKAQAVATRTYTLRKVIRQMKHAEYDLCTDASCCQAYMTIEDYLSSKGDEQDLNKLRNAVAQTEGPVLTYNGSIIEATYFSCSGGRTEDAVDVWGEAVPYLQSVNSPGEENARHYSSEIILTKEEFLQKLDLPENTSCNTSNLMITYTNGGGVNTVCIGGKTYSGKELRSLLSLPSTAVSIEFNDKTVTCTSKGYGHRVGMSQYGADAMAVSGKTYTQILYHYYPGTKLETFTVEQLNTVFDKAGNL